MEPLRGLEYVGDEAGAKTKGMCHPRKLNYKTFKSIEVL